MKKMKKPTNKNLFNIILERLKEQNLVPDILDYSVPAFREVEILSYHWSLFNKLDFGTNEGIYLDIYAYGDIGQGDLDKVNIGTFKTLEQDKDAMYTMAKLNADFVLEMNKYVNSHLDDFNWSGFDVVFFKNEQRMVGYTFGSRVDAMLRIKNERDYDYAILTDNRTKKEEKIMTKKGETNESGTN